VWVNCKALIQQDLFRQAMQLNRHGHATSLVVMVAVVKHQCGMWLTMASIELVSWLSGSWVISPLRMICHGHVGGSLLAVSSSCSFAGRSWCTGTGGRAGRSQKPYVMCTVCYQTYISFFLSLTLLRIVATTSGNRQKFLNVAWGATLRQT